MLYSLILTSKILVLFCAKIFEGVKEQMLASMVFNQLDWLVILKIGKNDHQECALEIQYLTNLVHIEMAMNMLKTKQNNRPWNSVW